MHDNTTSLRPWQRSCLLVNPVHIPKLQFRDLPSPIVSFFKSIYKNYFVGFHITHNSLRVWHKGKEKLCIQYFFSKPFSMWKWFVLHMDLWFLKYIYKWQAYLEGLCLSKWSEDPKRNLKLVELNFCLLLAADSVKGLQLVTRALTSYQNCGWLGK